MSAYTPAPCSQISDLTKVGRFSAGTKCATSRHGGSPAHGHHTAAFAAAVAHDVARDQAARDESRATHEREAAALPALNMRLRDDYVRECARGVERWNRVIEKAGVDFRLTLPHVAFNRAIGEFASINAAPDGQLLEDLAWLAQRDHFLPTADDGTYLQSLMLLLPDRPTA